jgi:hypothetical protein
MFDFFKELPRDHVSIQKERFIKGTSYIRDDGKIGLRSGIPFETDWIYHTDLVRGCFMKKEIWFKYYGFIPIRCQNCWKVVVKPRTVKETFQVLDVQRKLKDRMQSKVGRETRPYVEGHWGGYFYNDTKEEGFSCKKEVRKILYGAVSPDISVELKRGCTEMEQNFPDSSTWSLFPGQAEFEAELTDLIIQDVQPIYPPDFVVRNTKLEWIRWASRHGDMTYLEYTGGRHLLPPSKTYR